MTSSAIAPDGTVVTVGLLRNTDPISTFVSRDGGLTLQMGLPVTRQGRLIPAGRRSVTPA